MTFKNASAAIALSLTMIGSSAVYAQCAGQMNEKERKEAHAQAKANEDIDKEAAAEAHGKQKKALKAQAKADHQTHKALNDDGMKKAARKQDKANRKTDEANAASGAPVQ